MTFTLHDNVRAVISQCAHVLLDAGVAKDAGVEDDAQAFAVCEHEVLILLSEICGVSAGQINAVSLLGGDLGKLCTAQQLEQFEQWVLRRKNREPLQHIIGHAPFRFLDLGVGQGVFVPRPETELLIDEALEFVRSRDIKKPLIVDLCAGSGALGLAAATEIPNSTVYAVELSRDAYDYAQRNAARVGATNYTLLLGDATSSHTLHELDGNVDIVISNPPYVPEKDVPCQSETREYDPELALYGGSTDGMKIPQLIIERAYALLKPSGLLVMEHDWQQGSATCRAASEAGFTQAVTKQDLAHKDRYLYAVK